MNSMLTGCIAATTAFLVVSGGRIGIWPLVAWLAPAAIGGPAIALWTRYYQRRFSGAGAQGSRHTVSVRGLSAGIS